jgi:hypothetical protein
MDAGTAHHHDPAIGEGRRGTRIAPNIKAASIFPLKGSGETGLDEAKCAGEKRKEQSIFPGYTCSELDRPDFLGCSEHNSDYSDHSSKCQVFATL